MHRFGFDQKFMGVNPVCTCCNQIVAMGAKKTTVDEHILHDDCGDKLNIINKVKTDLQPAIKALPGNFFKGSNILERLEKAYTVSAFKTVLHDFCRYLTNAKQLLKDTFSQIVEAIKAAVERSKMRSTLLPVMSF